MCERSRIMCYMRGSSPYWYFEDMSMFIGISSGGLIFHFLLLDLNFSSEISESEKSLFEVVEFAISNLINCNVQQERIATLGYLPLRWLGMNWMCYLGCWVLLPGPPELLSRLALWVHVPGPRDVSLCSPSKECASPTQLNRFSTRTSWSIPVVGFLSSKNARDDIQKCRKDSWVDNRNKMNEIKQISKKRLLPNMKIEFYSKLTNILTLIYISDRIYQKVLSKVQSRFILDF